MATITKLCHKFFHGNVCFFTIEAGINPSFDFVFYSGEALLRAILGNCCFDLVFLDIQLLQLNGVQVGKQIREQLRNENISIVYISSKESYAMSLFQVSPLDFLVKPVTEKKVFQTLEKYMQLNEIRKNVFFFHVGKSVCRLYLEVYGKNPVWYGIWAVHLWQQMICGTFIFISGFVWQWGIEGNIGKGVWFNLFGFAISFVTLAFIPSETIWFGVLNFMGCAILLLFPLQKVTGKIPAVWGVGGVPCCLFYVSKSNMVMWGLEIWFGYRFLDCFMMRKL